MNVYKQLASALLLLFMLASVSCSPKQTNDARTQGTFVLYRLDGDRYPGDPVPEGAVLMHGWPILKECPIPSSATRHEIFAALDAGIDAMHGGAVPDCFNPRHAIRVNSGSVAVDYVICFECLQYEIWEGDKRVSGGLTTAAPEKTFDAVLAKCAEKKGQG